MFLKNRVPELSYILGELFNQFVSEGISFSSSVVPVIENVGCGGGRFKAKNYCPVSLFWGVSKIFKKRVNNRLLNYLENCGIFLIFSIVFGALVRLQTFWKLYLIELPGLQ